jgi:adhesin transport system outer membrane protein
LQWFKDLFIATGTGFVQVQSFTQAMRQALEVHAEVQAGVNNRLGADYQLKEAKGGSFPRIDLLGGQVGKGNDSDITRTASTHNHRGIFAPQVSRQRLSQIAFDGFSTFNEVVRQQAAEIQNIQLFTHYRFKATMSQLLKSQGVVAPLASVVQNDEKPRFSSPG